MHIYSFYLISFYTDNETTASEEGGETADDENKPALEKIVELTEEEEERAQKEAPAAT